MCFFTCGVAQDIVNVSCYEFAQHVMANIGILLAWVSLVVQSYVWQGGSPLSLVLLTISFKP